MTRKIIIVLITAALTAGGIAYGFTSQKSSGCPLEGKPDCPKVNCPLKGTPLCPYEDVKVPACCMNK